MTSRDWVNPYISYVVIPPTSDIAKNSHFLDECPLFRTFILLLFLKDNWIALFSFQFPVIIKNYYFRPEENIAVVIIVYLTFLGILV